MQLDEFIQNQFLVKDYSPNISNITLAVETISSTTKTLKFDVIVRFFNKVAEIRGRQKSKFIKTFIAHLFKNNRNPEYVYSILRLILPADDRERGNYGAKEKSLAIIIRDSLGLPKKDYERLKHYKNPSYHEGAQGMGDFPSIAANICASFCKKDNCINIDQLNKLLDDLVHKTQSKEQILIFSNILKQCTAEQILWVIRIILKDTKLGIKTETVLSQYHSDAQEYFNLTNSLKQVTKKFQNKEVSLKSQIMLFHPIKPMLAGKKPLNFFDKPDKQYILQTKFDGERLQVHMDQNDIKLFSRNAKDYTHIYKQLVPLLRSNLEADACILDGEVLVLQSHSLAMVPFGMNKQVALDKQNNPHLQICYKVFDCLWVKCENQDVNLMEHELSKRKDILSKFIKEIPGRLEIVKGELVSGSSVITQKFHQSISRNQQGLILKDPESAYLPADRSINWIKLKGDYFQGLSDTLDLMIIGGYYGQTSYRTTGNDWTDRITTFLLGIVTQLDLVNPKKTQIIPFCKVGTGYSQSQLSELRTRLRKNWIRTEGKRPNYIVGNWKPKSDDKPDCYINFPENSVILQIKAAQLIKSDAFGTEKTLRFPRVVKIRYDKQWFQCLGFKQLQNFIANEQVKGVRKRVKKQGDSQQQNDNQDKETVVMHATKKMKTGRDREKNVTDVLSWFKNTSIDQNDIISRIFSNKEFCVLNLKNYEQKPELQRKILENGGEIVQNPLSTTKYIISEVMDFKYRALASSKNDYFFIKPLYIEACVYQKRLVPLSPLYLSTIPKSKSQYFNTEFDYFGDSYSQMINLRQLDFLLQEMDSVCSFQQVDKQLLKKLTKANVYNKPLSAFCVNLTIEQRVNLRNFNYSIQQSITQNTQQIILGYGVNQKQGYLEQIRRTRPQISIRLYSQLRNQLL